jgi:hypothetical protein
MVQLHGMPLSGLYNQRFAFSVNRSIASIRVRA